MHASAFAVAGLAGLDRLLPAFSYDVGGTVPTRLSAAAPDGIDLTIGRTGLRIGGRDAHAATINGSIPGPLLRFREGDTAIIRVTNTLAEDTSIHWHGVIVPNPMDGVPLVTYPGIKPGETFRYEFPIRQSGTYWYHSHSGMQEQLGVYGPLVIDPAEPDPFTYDREHVMILSDWTFENPDDVMAHLKKMGGYYNYQRQTLAGMLRGDGANVRSRLAWARMRMDPTDIADVTGYAYIYLLNGRPPGAAWTGLFRPGERVRLRIINGSAATYFDVRIPGLELTVVQADGQDVQPVTVAELRVAIAETYDVIVQPTEDRAYTIFAETMDRSGFALGTIAPREGMRGPVPGRRVRARRSMADMGMTMGSGGQASAAVAMPDMPDTPGMSHAGHTMPASADAVPHGLDHHGPGNSMVPEVTQPRLGEPGIGLGDDGWRVLAYRDLRSAVERPDEGEPDREFELHLTGNMERYMWSFDGRKYSDAREPIRMRLGERVRMTLVNDTMMEHPIHVHGMWMRLENGAGERQPRKHTINVKPAERVSVLLEPDVPGKWALHCHILYHMEAGMFRVVEVTGHASD